MNVRLKKARAWAEGGDEKPYSVTLWDTDPNLFEDTCNTGRDFATIEEALDCVSNISVHFDMRYYSNTPFVLLDGPDVWEVTQRCCKKPIQKDDDDDEWRREQAMQAGRRR